MIEHMSTDHCQASTKDDVEPSSVPTNFILCATKRKKGAPVVVKVKCDICKEVCPTLADQVEHSKIHAPTPSSISYLEQEVSEGVIDESTRSFVLTSEDSPISILNSIKDVCRELNDYLYDDEPLGSNLICGFSKQLSSEEGYDISG